VRPDLVGCLTMGSWGPGASPVTLFSLAVNLAGMPEVTPRVTALNIVKDLQYSHDLSKQEFENLLASLVTSLAGDTPAGFSDLIWEMGAKLLIHRGRTADAVEAVMAYIGSARRYGDDHYAWRAVA